MVSATQILAQRATPATRTKARFTPYNAIPSTASFLAFRSPTSLCLNAPMPFVSSPKPSQTVNASCEPSRQRQPLPTSTSSQPQPSKEPIQRDASKQKFAVGLIDQAVKTLSEIWRPNDIPRAFLAPMKGAVPAPSPSIPQLLVSTGNESDSNNLLPLKSFVHEVLKRSRTSGSILQTALCYLEAVRPTVPGILRDEQNGIRAYYQPESIILPATEAELEMDRELSKSEAAEPFVVSDDLTKTVRLEDHLQDECDPMLEEEDSFSCSSSIIVEPAMSSVGATTTALPSPLLCPRRAFLAALILASKFSQDKCYSNRAWAKLSGLPPREIGRCERALGQALEWRLWVGKSPLGAQSPTPAATPGRTFVRSQSEGTIASPSSSRAPFLASSLSSTVVSETAASASPQVPTDILPSSRGLRKCATMPTEAFVLGGGGIPSVPSIPRTSVVQDLSCDTANSVYQLGPDLPMEVVETSIDAREQFLQPSTSCARPLVPHPPSDYSSDSGSSPDTPSLSYSPSTTDCSSGGDRTIQMASFEEGCFPAFNTSQPWLETTDPRFAPPRTASPASFCGVDNTNGADVYLAGRFALSLAAMQAAEANTNTKTIPNGYGGIAPAFAAPRIARRGSSYLWHADGGGRASLEATRVF